MAPGLGQRFKYIQQKSKLQFVIYLDIIQFLRNLSIFNEILQVLWKLLKRFRMFRDNLAKALGQLRRRGLNFYLQMIGRPELRNTCEYFKHLCEKKQ